MITTTHPNNRYSIEKLNQKYRVFKSNYIDFKNPIFKIFPKPGEIVLAGNFRVGYTDTALKITPNNSDMMHIGEGIGASAPHGSINYLENICKKKYRFKGWKPPVPPYTNPIYQSFNTQIDEVTIEEVYSTTSNFPIYLKVEVILNYTVTLQLFDKQTYSSLSIDLDFDLMQ
tara:strand:+ start:3327 stop:3842 length:516 start_codon:yes stop_codon:yes gene_type:complete